MKVFKTSDLALAAFMLMNGLKLKQAKVVSGGRFYFELEDEDDKATDLSLEFINSKFADFDNQIRNLKKILYSNK